MASIAGLYSFGAGRGRGGEDHSGDHRGDLGDRGGGGFRSGLFKKGRLGCSNNTNSQERSQVVKTFVELGKDVTVGVKILRQRSLVLRSDAWN